MKFDTGTKTRVYVDMVLEVDPGSATLEIEVDGDWYPADWEGDAIHTPATAYKREYWTQTAQTTGSFAGPDVADPGSAVVLSTGRHLTQTRVTSGSDVLVADSTPIDVK